MDALAGTRSRRRLFRAAITEIGRRRGRNVVVAIRSRLVRSYVHPLSATAAPPCHRDATQCGAKRDRAPRRRGPIDDSIEMI